MQQVYNQEINEVLQQYDVQPQKGLTLKEAEDREVRYGKNQLDSRPRKSLLVLFLDQFKSFMVLILLVAASVSGVIGILHDEGLIDTYIILGILIINAVIGAVQERKADSSLEALNKMSSPHSKVLRDGQVTEIIATDIVPGDIIILETGDIVPADLRLIETNNLQIQESALTGESIAVTKHVNTLVGDDISLGDRENMAYSTSMITYGRGKGVVVATGMKTEVGKIATLLQQTDTTETPMKKRLEELGKILGYVALAICGLIFIIGVVYGNSILATFMMAVSLAVAAIPEGLQVVSTIVLAIGVQRMAKSNAIIRTLPSVESLGSATVICSDKTGTLTQNKMTVVDIWTTKGNTKIGETDINELSIEDKSLWLTALLCSDSHLNIDENGIIELSGDPTETAIVEGALNFNLNKNEVEKEFLRIDEIPFDSDRKRMTTINRKDSEDAYLVNVKGGVDEILERCNYILKNGNEERITDNDLENIRDQNTKMAESALRVLAVANKKLYQKPELVDENNIERDLIFIGLIGMIDPARPEVIEAIAKCKTAGIRPIMITGDHKITAMAIAKEIGLYQKGEKVITGSELNKLDDEILFNKVHEYSVYARVAPEHKVRIVKAWQSHGDIVSMTGDGVNDAPALKQADIGTAMGIVGTEVAKDASDVILTDDNFATIVLAVEEGRRIYDNILKSIQFLLSSNIGEVIVIFIASVFNLGNPLLPIHILWINLVTDSLPALALSTDPAVENIMTRRPRKSSEGFFTKGMTWRIVYQGMIIGLISLCAYLLGLKDGGAPLGQTMAFAVLAFAQLFHVRNLHSNRISSFKISLLHNKMLVAAIVVSAAMMLVILLYPPFMKAFKLVQMDIRHWLYIIGLSITPIIVVELFKLMNINSFKEEF